MGLGLSDLGLNLLETGGSTTPKGLFSLGEAFAIGSKELLRELEGKLRTP